jgi:3-oxoacyl-[acyl-carrier-protein] synthase II
MTSRVFVTGAGVVSSLGFGREAFNIAIREGRTGARPIESFDPDAIGRNIAAEVREFRPRDHLTAAEARRMGRCSAFCVAAARMALGDAGLVEGGTSADRTAVVLGTTMGEADVIARLDTTWIQKGREAVNDRMLTRYGTTLLPIHVARAIGARGMVLTLPAACAAGNYAIGFAADLIRRGRADVVVTGAAEIIEKLQFSGFVRLGAVAPEKCQPFDANRQGLIVGEGAGILVLESEAHAMRRNAPVLAEVGGYGLACDAYHITRPHPEGEGTSQAVRDAIRTSGLSADRIDFVNAHGTGTRANDAVEAKIMREIFGERRVPISSVKSMIGHCMGAASALEAVSCLDTVQSGWYPPTIHYESPDPECDLEIVANTARRGPHDVVLNNSLAFGGYDAALIFARPGVIPADAPVLS